MERLAHPPRPALQDFRGAAGQLASSVAIVIVIVGGIPHATTASSGVVMSVDPPLFAVSFSTGSRMHDTLAAAGEFTASLLREDDYRLARHFADPARATGWPGLAGLDLVRRDPSPPTLAQAAVWLACRLRQVVAMGNHTCFVGEVVDCDRDPAAPPLIYYRGRFHSLGRPVAPTTWASLDRSDLTAEW